MNNKHKIEDSVVQSQKEQALDQFFELSKIENNKKYIKDIMNAIKAEQLVCINKLQETHKKNPKSKTNNKIYDKLMLKYVLPPLWVMDKKYIDRYVTDILEIYFKDHPVIKTRFFIIENTPIKQKASESVIEHVRTSLHNEIIAQFDRFKKDWAKTIKETPAAEGVDKNKVLNTFLEGACKYYLNKCKTMQLNFNTKKEHNNEQ